MDCRLLLVVMLYVFGIEAGSPCPAQQEIHPCYCTSVHDDQGYTIVVCPHIANSSELKSVMQSMKGLIIDRLLLLSAFSSQAAVDDCEEECRLPTKWLMPVRVKELEIQRGQFSSCFLCDDPFYGQSAFLRSLTATSCHLDGQLCSICNSRTTSVSTRELQKVPKLKHVDFTGNDISVIDGFAFPAALRDLRRVILAENKIHRIHDNAFVTLPQLTELDLSKNHLSSISRKMFRSSDTSLKSLDLSWNVLSVIPEDMFDNMHSLRKVKLSYNMLEVLSAETWLKIPPSMDKIDVTGNFLVCNCSISWLSQFLGKVSKILGKCAAPKEVELQELKGIANGVTDNCTDILLPDGD